jgi:NAD(P)H-nitrite reductase large subunit
MWPATAVRADRIGQHALRSGYADLLIIGNGIAGFIAAVEARRYAPDADILLVTAQNHPTINTPALKQFGAGRLDVEQLLAYPPGIEHQLRIGVVHLRAERLNIFARQVQLETGHTIKYGRLLLATGARPTGLPLDCPGRDFDGVITLHRLADYLDLRRRLPTVAAAVVTGGGYHAAETALLLRQWRLQVTWLIRGRRFLSRLLDEPASDMLLHHVQRLGVEVRRETEIAGIVGRIGATAGVVTTANQFIPCQLVVACTGVRPAVDLVEGTGLTASSDSCSPGGQKREGKRSTELSAVSAGILVNEYLQTAAPDIFAAGDVAAVPDPLTGRHETRAQWYAAFQQGRLAAAALTGAPVLVNTATGALGAFWHATQIGALNVLAAGAPMLSERDHPDNEVLVESSASCYRRIVVRHDRLIGYLAVGYGLADSMAIKRLIDEQIDIRDCKRQLLTADFDARAFFTKRQLYALQAAAPYAGRQRLAVGF